MFSSNVRRLREESRSEGPRVGRRTAILALLGAGMPAAARLARDDDKFLDELSHRAFKYFLDQSDRTTGLTLDRSRTDGNRVTSSAANVASIAATGFGLTALAIGADRGWI